MEATLRGPSVGGPRPYVTIRLWPASSNEVLLVGAFAPAAAVLFTSISA